MSHLLGVAGLTSPFPPYFAWRVAPLASLPEMPDSTPDEYLGARRRPKRKAFLLWSAAVANATVYAPVGTFALLRSSWALAPLLRFRCGLFTLLN